MWLTLIVAETISASSGIGYMTMNAREFLQTDVVLLGIIVYALLGKLADVLTRCDRAARARLAPRLSAPQPEPPHDAIGHRCVSEAGTLARADAVPSRRHAGSSAAARRPASASRSCSSGVEQELRRARACCRTSTSTIPAGAVPRHRRALGRRQDDAAAPDRRARRADRRARSLIDGAPVDGAAALRPAALPGRAAAALAAGDRQCRHRPRAGLARDGAGGARRCRPRRPRRRLAGRALRRPEAARGAGARAGQPARRAAARRAVRRARRADPRRDARAARRASGGSTASPPC